MYVPRLAEFVTLVTPEAVTYEVASISFFL